MDNDGDWGQLIFDSTVQSDWSKYVKNLLQDRKNGIIKLMVGPLIIGILMIIFLVIIRLPEDDPNLFIEGVIGFILIWTITPISLHYLLTWDEKRIINTGYKIYENAFILPSKSLFGNDSQIIFFNQIKGWDSHAYDGLRIHTKYGKGCYLPLTIIPKHLLLDIFKKNNIPSIE